MRVNDCAMMVMQVDDSSDDRHVGRTTVHIFSSLEFEVEIKLSRNFEGRQEANM